MISVQLAPVASVPSFVGLHEIYEAFAMTYLSGYNDSAFESRVQTSMLRSWSMTSSRRFPRVTNGMPGFILALIGDGTTQKIVVAIEGTSELPQVISGVGAANGVRGYTGLLHYIMQVFKTRADEIWTAISGNDIFVQRFNDPHTPIVFTGHSLGAACAEVLATRMKVAMPTRDVKLVKFASPLIGNNFHVEYVRRNIPFASVYCDDDPIHMLLPASITLSTSGIPGYTTTTFYSRPGGATTITRDGGAQLGYRQPYVDFLRAVANVGNRNTPLATWWWHAVEQYRVLLTRRLDSSNDSLAYRFRFSEFPNENNWGQSYIPGAYSQPGWFDIVAPQPDPVTPRSSFGNFIGVDDAYQPDTGIGASGGGEWGMVDESLLASGPGGGGVYGQNYDTNDTPVRVRGVLAPAIIDSRLAPMRRSRAMPPS